MAEDLVPAASDRLVGRAHQAEQDVAQRVGTGHLRGTREVERPGAVMQQGRVRRAQGGRHRRVGLMPGRPDRVEAVSSGPQVAGSQVKVAVAELGVEQRQRQVTGEPAARPHRSCQ